MFVNAALISIQYNELFWILTFPKSSMEAYLHHMVTSAQRHCHVAHWVNFGYTWLIFLMTAIWQRRWTSVTTFFLVSSEKLNWQLDISRVITLKITASHQNAFCFSVWALSSSINALMMTDTLTNRTLNSG